MRNALKIDCIESTLSGEGKFAGYPCTLIRLLGCNLSCLYCDWIPKEVAFHSRREMNMKKIADTVASLGNKYVLITGGEPLLQEETIPLVYELSHSGYIVWIETNGSINIDKDEYRRSWFYTMDIKCPSSGMAQHNKYNNLKNLQRVDEVKFVINDYTDYMFATGILKQFPTMASIIFSPCFDTEGNHNGNELADWVMRDRLVNVRVGLQIHKILGVS